MDQGCLGHIFLEVNSHSVPKDKHRTFEKLLKIKNLTKNVSPNIYCMLNYKIQGHLFPYQQHIYQSQYKISNQCDTLSFILKTRKHNK